MPVLVDTFNVLHTTGVLPPELAGVGLEGLAVLVRSSRYAREQVTLVCDGFGTENALDETRYLRVAYAGLGRTADDLIAEMVNTSTAPRLLIVVSSDNQVLRSAKRRGSRRLTAEQFLQHLADDAHSLPRTRRPSDKPAAPASEDDVARWIVDFDLSEEEMSHPAAAPVIQLRMPSRAAPRQPSQAVSDVRSGEENRSGPDPACDRAPPPANPPGGELPQLPFPDLPDDLIREAESMWNRHAPHDRDP